MAGVGEGPAPRSPDAGAPPPPEPEEAIPMSLTMSLSKLERSLQAGVSTNTVPMSWVVEHGKLLRVKTKLEMRVDELTGDRADGEQLTEELRQMTDNYLGLERLEAEHAAELAELKSRVQGLVERNDFLEAENREVREVNHRLGIDLAIWSQKETVLVAALKEVVGRESALLARVDVIEGEKARVESELDSANAHVASLSAELSDALVQIANLKLRCKDFDILKARHADLKSAKAEVDAKLADTEVALADTSGQLTALQAEHTEALAAIDAAAEANRLMKHTLWTADVQFRELRRELKEARAETEVERAGRALDRKRHASAFKDLSEFNEGEARALKTMLDEAKAKLVVQTRLVRRLERHTEELETEVTHLFESEGESLAIPLSEDLAELKAAAAATDSVVEISPMYTSVSPTCRKRNFLISQGDD